MIIEPKPDAIQFQFLPKIAKLRRIAHECNNNQPDRSL